MPKNNLLTPRYNAGIIAIMSITKTKKQIWNIHGVTEEIKRRFRNAIYRETIRTGLRPQQHEVFEEMVVWYEGEIERREGKKK